MNCAEIWCVVSDLTPKFGNLVKKLWNLVVLGSLWTFPLAKHLWLCSAWLVWNIFEQNASMENFHPLRRTPSPHWCAELGALLRRVCAGLRRTRRTRHWAKFVLSALEKYCVDLFLVTSKFCWPFLNNFLNFCWPFYASLPFLLTFYCFFDHFSDFFGLVSPVTCAEISLCAENSVTLVRWVWRMATTADIFGITCIFSSLGRMEH